ncbi:MAG: hypothetical protein VKS61_16530 [Candidatus Sericytochromatia bacterium]|nr:hypothetical protein [Candidatus Sericytochromatia bacterium]
MSLLLRMVVCLIGLTGCQAAEPGLPRGGAGAAPAARLALTPSLGAGTGRRLQAVPQPLTAAQVHHLVVTLATVPAQGPDEVLATRRILAPAAQGGSVSFDKLAVGRTYRARGVAYAGADDTATGIISVDELSSVTIAVPVGVADLQAVLPVRLRDTTFAASVATTGTLIATGALVTTADETLELVTP